MAKLSAGKATSPGPKQVFRGPTGDVIGLREEDPPAGHDPLLERVMAGGRRISLPQSLDATRDRLRRDLGRLPDGARQIQGPVAPRTRLSPLLEELGERTRSALTR